MKKILTVDQGNTSAKAVVWENGIPVKTLRVESLTIEDLLPVFEIDGIEGCAYCSVCHTDAKFIETLRRLVDGRLLVLTPSVPLPIKVCYGSRSTLGNDRVAAAVGAHALMPGDAALVVDAGTAVTIDVIDRDGGFLGGNIAPGMHLRFKSLKESTQQLPMVDEYGELPSFGTDTESAIRCGVVGGMVSEIVDAYARASSIYGCSRVVLAGSDGAVLEPLLKERGLPVITDPNLVGRGLAEIFEYCAFSGDSY
ncbi:MAG: type III pantothenate kinase [Muribaculaceae bacterium]|nr:type III pantothenate kinase [Muribaculaceae bacterium]